MVTGDHPQTALAISKQLGIADSEYHLITGAQLPQHEQVGEAWWNAIKDKTVFARVSPIQKMMITSTLSANGHFVAVTGDGVNDVPALKRAHIGIAMGTGTDLAKDTADIIVTNDDFSSIVAGVEEGRYAYDNIRKVIALLVSTGAAEIIVFLLAMGIDLGYDTIDERLPFSALQLLWLNLVTNGIQDKALAYEKGEADAMSRKPRNPKEGIFNRLMIEQILVGGATMGVLAFSCWTVLAAFDFSVEHKRTLTLMLMVLMQNMHVFNCRSERKSAFRIPIANNKFLIWAVLGAQAIHIIASNIPFMQRILRTDTVSIQEWLILLPVAFCLILVMEVYKWGRAKAL
jgi:magnesium-transporting ATPase (P-type)